MQERQDTLQSVRKGVAGYGQQNFIGLLHRMLQVVIDLQASWKSNPGQESRIAGLCPHHFKVCRVPAPEYALTICPCQLYGKGSTP
jgi:hypothetical protein